MSLRRNRSGAFGIFTVTGSILSPSTVPASAYPGHYPRHLLFGESSSSEHSVGTSSEYPRASEKLSRSNCSFCVTVEPLYPPGFLGVKTSR
jgi:hypothetical protein